MTEVEAIQESADGNIISLDELLPHDKEYGQFFLPKHIGHLGLSREALERHIQELEGNIGVEGEYHPIKDYALVISFIEAVLGFKGRNIVEIGPRNDGTKVLKYMASKGANAIGLDIGIPKEPTQGIRFVQDRWENIATHARDVDVIYTIFMHPDPEDGGPFECRELSDEPKMSRYKRDFEACIAKEMAKVLKPNGIFMVHYIDFGPQYMVGNQDIFEANGFRDYIFSTVLTHHELRSAGLHVMQKKR